MFYEIPYNLQSEIDESEQLVKQFQRGDLGTDALKAGRLPFGYYEQRREGSCLLRVRATGGAVTPARGNWPGTTRINSVTSTSTPTRPIGRRITGQRGPSTQAGNTRTDSAHNRYQISPLDLIKIERSARERGLEIAGFCHSHPDHPARWSKTDFEEAHWVDCSYVIMAVEKGRAAQTNSFALVGTSEETNSFGGALRPQLGPNDGSRANFAVGDSGKR